MAQIIIISEMEQYGLIGKSLGHSKSPELFNQIFYQNNVKNAAYDLFELSSAEEILNIVNKNKSLKGFNVTIPFKHEIIRYLNFIDKTSSEIGAVNTVKIVRSENSFSLHGYNTDAPAFEQSLNSFCDTKAKKALILGNGGAAMAVKYVFNTSGIKFLQVSRNKSNDCINYHEITADIISTHLLIVNCTPSGMWPDINTCPNLPYQLLSDKHYLFDLIYNPELTLFLKKGKAKGCKIKNGLEMLELQALKAWKIWQKDIV